MKWLSVFPLIGVSLLASDDHTSALSDAAEASTPAQGIDFSAEFLKPQLRAHDTASEERMDPPNIHFPGNFHISENVHIPPGDANVLTRVTEGNAPSPDLPDLPVYHKDQQGYTYIPELDDPPQTSQLKTNPQSSEEKAEHNAANPQSSEEKGKETDDEYAKDDKEFAKRFRAGVIKEYLGGGRS